MIGLRKSGGLAVWVRTGFARGVATGAAVTTSLAVAVVFAGGFVASSTAADTATIETPDTAAIGTPNEPPASISILRAWSRATAPGTSIGVAYFEVVNAGAADTLVGIECPVAERVEMHATTTENGMMRMRLSTSVAVPAGGRLVFEPGGLHAMLINLKHPLKEGERLPLTLTFQRFGPLPVEAIIRGLGASGPAAD